MEELFWQAVNCVQDVITVSSREIHSYCSIHSHSAQFDALDRSGRLRAAFVMLTHLRGAMVQCLEQQCLVQWYFSGIASSKTTGLIVGQG